MAWIESHQEIAQHPKTLRLARYLSVSIADAIGRLHLLWWWATNYAADGDLSSFDAEDLAAATLWDGDTPLMLDSLKRAGFIDEDGQLHDWDEYAGRLIERRRQDAERKRSTRGPSIEDAPRTSGGRPPDVRTNEAPTGAGRPVVSGVTVPNPTVPNPTSPPTPIPAATSGGAGGRVAASAAVGSDRPKPVPKKVPGPNLAPLFDGFKAAGLSPPALIGRESAAAQDLLRHYSGEQLAACWQDYATGQYGNDVDHRNLSFGYLANNNRVGNWLAWKAGTNGRVNGHGENRQPSGGFGQGPRRANAGAGGGAAGEVDPFAKYVRSDEHPNGTAGGP